MILSKSFLPVILLLGSMSTACGSESKRANAIDDPKIIDKPEPELTQEEQMRQDVLDTLVQFRARDEGDTRFTCNPNDVNTSLCASENLIYKPKPLDTGSNRTRVLIVDWGMELQALLRYQSKNLGIFTIESDGAITEKYMTGQKTDIRFPRSLFDLYTEWDQKGYYSNTFMDDNSSLLNNRFNFFGYSLHSEWDMFAHGNAIYAKLAETNPLADILVLQGPRDQEEILPVPKDAAGSCWFDDPRFHPAFENSTSRFIEDLVGLIDRYSIEYINYSFGRNVLSICADASEDNKRWFLSQYQKLEKALSEISGTVLVQAGGNYPRALSLDERESSDWPECNTYANRVLAFVAEKINPDWKIPEEGFVFDEAFRLGILNQQSVYQALCEGLFVSFGRDLSNPMNTTGSPVLFSKTGLFQTAHEYQTSSFAAPLLINYLDFDRRKNSFVDPDEALFQVKRSIVIDPILNQQLPRIENP